MDRILRITPVLRRKPTMLTTTLRTMGQVLVKLRLLWIILLAPLMLSGCVNYNAGVSFAGSNHGEIVQRINLSDRLTTFSDTTARQLINTLEQRARRLQGKVQRNGNQETLLTIPFNNGADLEAKFNEFFQPPDEPTSRRKTRRDNQEPTLPDIESHLSIVQNNFLLFVRNRLVYNLDLRSLGVLASDGSLLVSPGSLIELEFSLETPWGARSITPELNEVDVNNPPARQQGKKLVWTLQPGQLNHLETIFWLPSYLGIGTVAIILLVAGGMYLKSLLPPTPAANSGQAVLPKV